MPHKRKQAYYSKVVEDLLNYKEYKQRIKVLDYKLESKLEPSAYSYEKANGGSGGNGIFDSTLETVLDRLEGKEAQEYNDKLEIVNLVEIAVAGLDPKEKYIISNKYMKGRVMNDVDIYTDHDFGYGRRKYYEIKDEAVAKMARILGYKKNV